MIFTSLQWSRDWCQHLKTWADLWCVGDSPVTLFECKGRGRLCPSELVKGRPATAPAAAQGHMSPAQCWACHQHHQNRRDPTSCLCKLPLSRQQQLAAVAALLINPSSLRGKVASVLKAFYSCSHHVDATCTLTFRGGIVGSSHLMDGLTS